MNAKIGLEDVRFHAPHGFYEEEHRSGNEFSIDVEVESDIHSAATQDDLGGTVNYSTIYYLLQAEMKKPTQLLEALAFRMASRIQNQFPQVTSVKLRLRKLNPPLGGQVGAAVVEVNLGASSGGGGSMAAMGGMAGGMGGSSTFDEDEYGSGGFGGGGYSPGPFAGGKPALPAFLPQDDDEDYGEFEDEDEDFELNFDDLGDDMEGDFEDDGFDPDGDFEGGDEEYYDDGEYED